MYALINPFVQIALLRCKPQDLPASVFLLKIALVVHVMLGILMFTSRLSLPQSVVAGATSTLIMCVLTSSLLFANRHSTRIVQTLTAMAGSDVVVGAVALPVTACCALALMTLPSVDLQACCFSS